MSDTPGIQHILRQRVDVTQLVSVRIETGKPVTTVRAPVPAPLTYPSGVTVGEATRAADRIDALEAQLARAVEALVTGDGISLLCPDGGCRCPDPDGTERRRIEHEYTDADLDACRACWRQHLETTQ